MNLLLPFSEIASSAGETSSDASSDGEREKVQGIISEVPEII